MNFIKSGINFGFNNDKFFVEYNCSRPVGNLREEFNKRAIDLYKKNPKQMLGLSTGLDSQSVLHSFFTQGIPLEVAFLYLIGSNENELERLRILEKKYGFKAIVITIDPHSKKEEILNTYDQTGIPPFHLLHLDFLNQLPSDYDFIQGIHGPDLFFRNNNWYMVESANSFELSRLRAFQKSKRVGDIIGWERTGEILLSLLTDDVVESFVCAYPYIYENGLRDTDGERIKVVDYWDVYIKPFIYGKYWRNELEYFPKYQGPEKIDWIMNKKWHQFEKNLIPIPLNKLKSHLSTTNGEVIRFWQRSEINDL